MSPIHREAVEWCDIWIRAADQSPGRRRVLFIGDSITRGLYAVAERLLSPIADCARICTSRFLADPVFFQELALVLGQHRFAAIHVNNGLHGWEFSEQAYADGLPILLQYLHERAPEARLLWAHSTRVRCPPPLVATQGPDNARVLERNRIAAGIMVAAGVPVNDLYACTAERPELFSPDGVHYTPEGYEALGAQAAEAVRRLPVIL